MKREFCIFIVLFLVFHIHAQLVYHDASNFPLLGRATESAGARYERFPDSLRNISRAPLWNLSRNSAGMAIRFRSNSTTIAAKWVTLFNTHMNHMTDTGVKGLDLYCLQKNGNWRFVNSARPKGKTNQATIIKNMYPEEREYMLYLPLYDGLISLSIGVDSLATISLPLVDYPIRKNPVVFYGTSILQGGCASRPGMAHTNIISRRLNRECINLGFSGNAFLDLEVAKVIAEIEASVFVLDFVPNASVAKMKERMETFYRIIRNKHPDTPIIFIEDPIFPQDPRVEVTRESHPNQVGDHQPAGCGGLLEETQGAQQDHQPQQQQPEKRQGVVLQVDRKIFSDFFYFQIQTVQIHLQRMIQRIALQTAQKRTRLLYQN